jgi:hypothetical protein
VRLMAEAICWEVPLGKVTVRMPRRNSEVAGVLARAERTLARTMAWRKRGTGALVPPRLTKRVLPSRVTFARMREASWGCGAVGVVGCAARPAVRCVVVLGRMAFGGAMEDSAVTTVAVVAGTSTVVRGVVHAVSSKAPRIGEMRALPDMDGSLSCAG